VDGPFVVTVSTGKAVSARASGSPEAIERLTLRVEGRTMLIKPNASGWGGLPGKQSAPVRISVTTPELTTAMLLGSGSLDIDRIRGARVILTVEGSGRLAVRAIDADNVSLAVAGAGTIEAAGRTRQAAGLARGAAEIHAGDLIVSDLTLTSQSAGAVTMNAVRSAKVSALGVGPVSVFGSAACEVRQLGSGPLSCGKGSDQSQRR
jgi:hypothetical protein